ncbi:unnamed protein product [Sphagnum jensenii]|uniref:Glycine-rich protein n=1 Tax=Sphagnum jensenii TaxID=128206 RepID=A0ABP1B5Q2_9BRYO
MQGRGGNRPGPFDGFPDPFANFGFGMMGGGRGGVGGGGGGGAGFGSQGGMRSLFDVFDNDPFFSDPFFTRPFGGSFGSFLGSRGGLGHPFFGLPQPAFEPRQALYLHNQPDNPQGGEHRRGPIIEELPDDAEHPHEHVQAQSSQEPIIEHPDDDVRPASELPQQSRIIQQQGPLSTSHNNRTQSFSFQSSSVSYGGPNGVHYSTSATRRMGPNGVIEEEFQEKDSRSGKETKHVSRGVGEKGLSLTRKRTSEGREERLDTLHNLNEEEIPDFERTWEEHEKMLPRWNKTRPLGIGSSYNGGSGSRRRAALPSPEDWPTNPP